MPGKKSSNISDSFELIHKDWKRRFAEAFGSKCRDLRLMAPFIKLGAIEELLATQRPKPLRVLTRFNLADCRAKAQDIEALKLLLDRGAQVKGVKGLHSKLYIFDKSTVILGSANLTKRALGVNHELGVMIREPEAVNTCAGYFDRMWSKAKEKLTHKKLRKWQHEIDAAERKDKWRGNESSLRDYGSTVDQEFEAELSVDDGETRGRQVFVKIFGTAGNRAKLTATVWETVDSDGSHWACTYPKTQRPRQPRDGDIFYFARMVDGDHRIYGRGVGLAYVKGRDDASGSAKERRTWKRKWPRYIRIHGAEFIDGRLKDCPSLMELFDALKWNALASTHANAREGRGKNLDPRSSMRRRAAVMLAPVATAWMENEFERCLRKRGAISRKKLEDLDWPESARWLSDEGRDLLALIVGRIESGRIDVNDPRTFPNYGEIAVELGLGPGAGHAVIGAVRRHGLDSLDAWVRHYRLPVVSGFIVRRDHRRRPGPTFYRQHRKRTTNDAWWFGELRRSIAYPWRKLMD